LIVVAVFHVFRFTRQTSSLFRLSRFSDLPFRIPVLPLFSSSWFPSFTVSRFPNFSAMIITRSPLRVSLGGGGTDLPSYYREHGGFLVAAAIDKYVYITLHQTFVQELIIKYSKLEHVTSVDQVEHPIIREAIKFVGIDNPYLELTSMADIPAGTGLGSSGSFTTALLKALHAYKRNIIHPAELAAEA
jgi:D-glycero-alpha-D-manno-heptose-7-phosphate kinase